MNKQEMREAIVDAKAKKGVSWEELGRTIGLNPVFVCSAALGENSMPGESADALCEALGLPSAVSEALQTYPIKGQRAATLITDPLVYRFNEIVMVYGETLKEVVQEKMGDGIVSAIDFSIDVEKVPDPKGDRVKISMNGKFLPYRRW